MNKHKVFRAREINRFMHLLPILPPKKIDGLLAFLDKELDREGPLDKETLILLLDQAAGKPLRREARENISEFLRIGEYQHSKAKLASLVRNALLANSMCFDPRADESKIEGSAIKAAVPSGA